MRFLKLYSSEATAAKELATLRLKKKVKHNRKILVPIVSKRAGYENKYNNQI